MREVPYFYYKHPIAMLEHIIKRCKVRISIDCYDKALTDSLTQSSYWEDTNMLDGPNGPDFDDNWRKYLIIMLRKRPDEVYSPKHASDFITYLIHLRNRYNLNNSFKVAMEIAGLVERRAVSTRNKEQYNKLCAVRDKMYNNFVYNTRYWGVADVLNEKLHGLKLDPFEKKIKIDAADVGRVRTHLYKQIVKRARVQLRVGMNEFLSLHNKNADYYKLLADAGFIDMC